MECITFKDKDTDFNWYYKKYYNLVYGHTLYIIGNKAETEDIVQETFLKLYTSPVEISNVSSWLVKVSTNLSYKHLRHRKVKRARKSDLEDNAMQNVVSIEDTAIKNFEVKLVRYVLDTLNPRDRICLQIKYSGYRYREIAKIMDLNQNSIGQVIARANKKFVKKYKREAKIK